MLLLRGGGGGGQRFYIGHERVHGLLKILGAGGFPCYLAHGFREGPQDDVGLGVHYGQSDLRKRY